MTQKNFYFRHDWFDLINSRDYDEQMELIRASVHFSRTGEIPKMTYYADEKFQTHILPMLRRRRQADEYRARAKARRLSAYAKNEAKQRTDKNLAKANQKNTIVVNPEPTVRKNRQNAFLTLLRMSGSDAGTDVSESRGISATSLGGGSAGED